MNGPLTLSDGTSDFSKISAEYPSVEEDNEVQQPASDDEEDSSAAPDAVQEGAQNASVGDGVAAPQQQSQCEKWTFPELAYVNQLAAQVHQDMSDAQKSETSLPEGGKLVFEAMDDEIRTLMLKHHTKDHLVQRSKTIWSHIIFEAGIKQWFIAAGVKPDRQLVSASM